MRDVRIIEISDEKKKEYLHSLYKYFKNGFEFEDFLKPLLEKLGLTEVFVTKKTRDGGIDLTAAKHGITEFAEDVTKYKIQAKRNDPTSIIIPEKIDALRGNLNFNEKGLFITTAKVSKKTKECALSKDPSKPVIVIDGLDLIDICIEKQIGFAYKPEFSINAMDEFLTDSRINDKLIQSNLVIVPNELTDYVKKQITYNDIRASIISIPGAIIQKMTDSTTKRSIKTVINGHDEYTLTFVPGRNYLGSVTVIFKKYGLKDSDGSIHVKELMWAINEKEEIFINIP